VKKPHVPRPIAELPEFITEEQARGPQLLQISRAAFYRLRKRSVITTYVVTGTAIKRYRKSEIEALIQTQPTDTPGTTSETSTDRTLRAVK
jgi:hypothetical protein